MMRLRTSDDQTAGVRTFHVEPSQPGSPWYTVKRLRRLKKHRWLCTCGDFMNRRMVLNQHCKHIKRIRAYAQTLGGVSRIPRGQLIEIPDTVPLAPRPKLVLKRST